MKLKDKVALITGAGSGIGEASAHLFSQEGAKVCIVDVDEKGGKNVAEAIIKNGGDAMFFKADVSDAGDAEKMITATVDAYGKLDILFNNAGVPMSMTPVEEVQEDLWDKIMDVNVKGIFLACKYAVPIMKNQGGGVIINTASISGVRARPGLSAYTASKGAAILLTRGLAIELAPDQIRVNCLNPVATDTPMFPKFIDDSGARDDKFEETKQVFIDTVPMGRLAEADDIAKAAVFLASEESSFITGVGLDVDGGRGI